MRTYIEHLRTKPEHTKNQIAFGVSAIVTFFIFMFWLSGQSISLSDSQEVAKKNESPFAAIGTMSANIIDAIKTGFGKNEVYVAPDIEVLPGGDKK
jgi:hypothetical protein